MTRTLTNEYSKDPNNRTPPYLPYPLPDPTPYQWLLSLSLQLSRPSPVAPGVTAPRSTKRALEAAISGTGESGRPEKVETSKSKIESLQQEVCRVK